ncbi:MAG: mechanosensitive ion channel [Deltaproteobacteria bacterium]|nr:mechanosensitive ion channel [Deltaproteobacteria bacterium]MBN2674648.1 mechanosensitive ion channel [Deltaproteobacteria bacterium]
MNLISNTFSILSLVVIGTLFFLVIVILVLLRRVEKRQRERMKQTSHDLPVETESPVSDPKRRAKRHALKSVKFRYSVIRHVLIGVALVLMLLGAAFPLLGTVPATMLSAILAILSIVIGIVARPVLENLVSGLMLTLSRAVNVSDTVIINDHYGTIEDITATHMVIKRWDWQRYVVPNAKVISTDFLNLSLYDDYQWAKVAFWVHPAADIDEVRNEAIQAAIDSKKIADHEPPHFWCVELDKQGVKCWVTAWADSPANAWDLRHEIRMNLQRRLAQKGILTHQHNVSIPDTDNHCP